MKASGTQSTTIETTAQVARARDKVYFNRRSDWGNDPVPSEHLAEPGRGKGPTIDQPPKDRVNDIGDGTNWNPEQRNTPSQEDRTESASQRNNEPTENEQANTQDPEQPGTQPPQEGNTNEPEPGEQTPEPWTGEEHNYKTPGSSPDTTPDQNPPVDLTDKRKEGRRRRKKEYQKRKKEQ